MLSNLAANARRHTAHGEVFIERTTSEGASVHLAVHDTGIGIPQEQLHAIFDDLYLSPERKNASQEGSGLGLGIARRVSKLLEVPVTVHSEFGRGSTFAVRIPPHKVF